MSFRNVRFAPYLMLGCLVLASCATGRTVVTLAPPKIDGSSVAAAARPVFIREVRDARVFEDAPGNPSTPSLGLDLSSKAPADIKARAVARKRHGYGLAQGDVLLSANDNVASEVRAHLASAFSNAGYRVTHSASGVPQPIVADVRITQFWIWLEPGVMVGTIRSRISTEISIASTAPLLIQAETSQPGQIFSEQAWTNAVSIALAEYRRLAAERLAAGQ